MSAKREARACEWYGRCRVARRRVDDLFNYCMVSDVLEEDDMPAHTWAIVCHVGNWGMHVRSCPRSQQCTCVPEEGKDMVKTNGVAKGVAGTGDSHGSPRWPSVPIFPGQSTATSSTHPGGSDMGAVPHAQSSLTQEEGHLFHQLLEIML